MEKLALEEVVKNDTFNASTKVLIDLAYKYTNNGDSYKQQYKEIGQQRRLLLRIILGLVLFLVIICCKYRFLESYLIFISSGFIAAVLISIYIYLLGEYSKLNGRDYIDLNYKIVNEIIDLHFKELFSFARNYRNIFDDAFQSARELHVSDEKIEPYIKGYIKNELDYLDEQNDSKNRKIDEVINCLKKQK